MTKFHAVGGREGHAHHVPVCGHVVPEIQVHLLAAVANGYLVEYVDWRLIFFINVPVGLLGAIAAFFMLPNFPGRPAGGF